MPELPEVELYCRYFARHALRQPIARADVRDERILGEIRAATFARKLRGRSFLAVRRHGKNLFADAGDAIWLHLHFGMTGDLAYYDDPAEEPRFARVVFDFENGHHLAFEDMRLFGVVELTGDPEAFIASRGLGPDPLDSRFRLRDFQAIVGARRGAIKSLLMSQEIIAGIGNLYADEALFQTGIHPRRGAHELAPDEVKRIYAAIRKILAESIARKERGRDYPPRYLILHREEGERCPRCGGTIQKTVVFGRTTFYCARHQR